MVRAAAASAFAAIIVAAMSGAGCFTVTTDVDGITGVRPVDAGDEGGIIVENDGGDAEAGIPFPQVGAVDCARDPHLLCTNFDLGGGLAQGGWIAENTAGGESLLDGARSVSRPASFRSTIPIVTTKTNSGGILRQSVRVGAWTAIRYGYDMFVSSCATTGGSTTLSAMQTSAATAFGLVLDTGNKYVFAQVLLDEGGAFKPHALSKVLVPNKWFRVDTRVELSAKAARLQVFIDGEQALDVPGEPRAPGTEILLNIGANCTGPVDKCDVNFDNVIFDKE